MSSLQESLVGERGGREGDGERETHSERKRERDTHSERERERDTHTVKERARVIGVFSERIISDSSVYRCN